MIKSIVAKTYKTSSPTEITEAVSMSFQHKSSPFNPLLMDDTCLDTGEEDFFTLPALSNLPSESKYAGLNFSLQLVEWVVHNNAFGTVSWMLPIEVYLQYGEKGQKSN